MYLILTKSNKGGLYIINNFQNNKSFLFTDIKETHRRIDLLAYLKSAKDYIIEITNSQLMDIYLNHSEIDIVLTSINLKEYPWDKLNIVWESNYEDD